MVVSLDRRRGMLGAARTIAREHRGGVLLVNRDVGRLDIVIEQPAVFDDGAIARGLGAEGTDSAFAKTLRAGCRIDLAAGLLGLPNQRKSRAVTGRAVDFGCDEF